MDNKELEILMDEMGNKAKNYHKEGINCAECVMRSFLDYHDTGMSEEIMCMATGFGGGIGRSRSICGAISGSVMALGTVKGRRDPFNKETAKERSQEVTELYVPFRNMFEELEEHFGTVICKEMLSSKKNCNETIRYCASVLARYANTQEEV